MDTPEKQPQKFSPLVRALTYLVVLFLAQLAAMWVAGKIFPPIPCGPFAGQPCQPYVTTEGLLLSALLPLIFLPFAVMQIKHIVMYAGALPPIKKLPVVIISVGMVLVMFWQFILALGALLGRWFG